VDQGRTEIERLSSKKEELAIELDKLEADLRCNEQVERRRNDVALETETNLSKVRKELDHTKRELIFVTNNRNDIEIALNACQI
jgi:hypothetical protein